MNKREISFSDEIISMYYAEDPKTTCPTITFQITEDCCLNCSYCYQINKTHKMMTKEIAKAGIDLLFKMYDENKEDAFINHHTRGIIIEFIGGEPLMNIDTMTYASDYFINQCVQKDHPWLTNFRFSLNTNGVLYFESSFQNYLQKFSPFVSLNITVDGPKHLHDACRKDYTGNGSFEQAIAAYRAWRDDYNQIPSTKVTIAPENLPYLNEIINFFVTEGSTSIHANPINEHVWTCEESKIYYEQLFILANTLLENPQLTNNIFSEHVGVPLLSSENSNWCGGTGSMLAFDPDGNAYPCLRYMPSSLGESRAPIIIGNVNGIYQTQKEKEIYNSLKQVTRRSQSTDECFNCPIAGGCSWCSAWNYQETGSYNKRSTNTCWMHRARSLVNSYYYNRYYRSINSEKRMPIYLNREIATQIIDDRTYDYLLSLSF